MPSEETLLFPYPPASVTSEFLSWPLLPGGDRLYGAVREPVLQLSRFCVKASLEASTHASTPVLGLELLTPRDFFSYSFLHFAVLFGKMLSGLPLQTARVRLGGHARVRVSRRESKFLTRNPQIQPFQIFSE